MEPRVTTVTALPGYRLALTFDDGTEGMVDCTPWLFEHESGLFTDLRDPAAFAAVFVNQEWGIVEWPNGVDVDPYLLYDLAHSRIAG